MSGSESNTGVARFAMADGAASPVFSADGRSIHHLRGGSMPQLWTMARDGSAARPLALLGEKVGFLRRAPKDERIIFGIDAGGDERQQFWMVENGQVRPLTSDGHVIHEFGCWSPDGTEFAYTANDRDEAHFDVLLRDAAGSTRRLACGVHQVTAPAWHPTRRVLLLMVNAVEGDQRLSLLDIDDGTQTPIPHAQPVQFQSVRWSSDGTHLLGLSDGGGEFSALCRIDAAAGTITTLVSVPGADLDAWSLSPDGSHLAVIENDRGWARLRVGPAGSLPPVVDLPPGLVSDLAWSPDGKTLAVCLASPTQPPGIHLLEIATGGWQCAWQPDAPADARPFALVEWQSEDGRRIPGWMAKPAGTAPEAGWPTVVWVHGGPAGQTRANWRPDMQMLLAQGYAVLMPNVRGSTGYGRIATASDDGALRPGSVDDLAAAHAWLVRQPGLDPARIGIMGQSYGGYMVLAAITRYPSLWRAAIDFYGIADFTTLLAGTGPWRRAHRGWEYAGGPHDTLAAAELFATISPIVRAAEITAPLLVLHGTRDPRVPFGESEQIVTALRDRDHPVRFERFDYAGHGFIRPADRCRAYAAVAAFLREWL
ncbi:MAG: S9 family peptidase [Acetobacteraceae bacterium]|nr:S9 family peptidase [Acetobacteraceae bacterium]